MIRKAESVSRRTMQSYILTYFSFRHLDRAKPTGVSWILALWDTHRNFQFHSLVNRSFDLNHCQVKSNQNTQEVKMNAILSGLDKQMCKCSANFAFDTATYERTNRCIVKHMEDETNTTLQSGG